MNEPAEERIERLPFSKWWPLLAGVLAGIALRLAFWGPPGRAYAPMMASFIYFTPLLVGAITVYLAEREKRRSWSYYFLAPFVANVLFVLGTMLIMIEGLICAVVIVPLFATFGMLGGVIMGIVCRATNWPRQAVYSIAVLPLVLGSLEAGLPLPERVRSIERTIVVDAPAKSIWTNILNARDIRPDEVGHAWVYRIGVPLTLAGVTSQTPEGTLRRVTMGKGVYFDQVLAESLENRYMRWTYRFYEDSFPPHALDDHVKIGGHYFDVKDTSYTFTPRGDATEVKMLIHYRVSTQFNWYAEPVAQGLLGNLEEVVLEFYRRRSESATAGTG